MIIFTMHHFPAMRCFILAHSWAQVAGAIQDYDVGISIMEDDFRQHPERMMYSEYPDALVKRGLAKVTQCQTSVV